MNFREHHENHEYQAKEILRKYHVALPDGQVAFLVDEAVAAYRRLGGWVARSA
ncbi:MAG: hypothetical protein ABH878_04155 [bacterium]